MFLEFIAAHSYTSSVCFGRNFFSRSYTSSVFILIHLLCVGGGKFPLQAATAGLQAIFACLRLGRGVVRGSRLPLAA